MDDKKTRMPRDMAGHIEFKEGTGPLICMCPHRDVMEVYKVDASFCVTSPDVLDPQRTDPNMSFVVTCNEGVGSQNPIVARVSIQTYELLKNAPLDSKVNVDDILELTRTCKELLLSLNKSQQEFAKQHQECIDVIEGKKLKKEGNALTNFPVINDIDHITTSFLINSKRFIETLAKIVNVFFETTFNGPRFDVIVKWAKKTLPKQDMLITFLETNNQSLKYIVDLRNHQEHPQKTKKTHIENFRLLPHKVIDVPVWYVTGEEKKGINTDMLDLSDFLLNFFEELLIHCIRLKLNTPFPYKLVGISEEKRDKACPIKYKIEIDQDRLFRKK